MTSTGSMQCDGLAPKDPDELADYLGMKLAEVQKVVDQLVVLLSQLQVLADAISLEIRRLTGG